MKQPAMPLDKQKHVYEASKVVDQAVALSYDQRGGMTTGRAAVIKLMGAGWRPPKAKG